MTTASDTRPARPTRTGCDPATNVTRSLLGYGVLAGPFYVVVSLTQALTRAGFDLTRHSWSLLGNGRLGWIQVTNLILTGLMVGAAAIGLRRALRPGVSAGWTGRLVLAYGLSLVAAGLLRADPSDGFPVGTPAGAGPVSWHGIGHLAVGAIGFACLIAACFVVAHRFSRDGRRGWAVFSRVTGIVFLAGFVGIASGAGNVAVNLGFTAAIIVVWVWLAAVCVHFYRHA
jgi:Protein of unknown function (DUF998)